MARNHGPTVRETEALTKHTVNLFAGDFDAIADLYPEVGAAAVIRRLIRNHIEERSPRTQIKTRIEL